MHYLINVVVCIYLVDEEPATWELSTGLPLLQETGKTTVHIYVIGSIFYSILSIKYIST